MRIGVPKETAAGEHRVALVPEVVSKLRAKGLDVMVQAGAGSGALLPDAAFEEAGASVASDAPQVWASDLVVVIAPPGGDEIRSLRAGAIVVGFLAPLTSPVTTRALADAGVTSFAMEAIPRITRAQSMDALSSQATVGGYLSALLAARELPRFFPMLTTAAGTIRPAKVLVLGAGVAGLQAIATARRLGAVVQAYDVRAAVKEQIESLGAKFVELPLEAGESQDRGGYARAMDESFYRRQRETMLKVVAGSEVVIATAAVPGQKAPVLLTAEMVDAMPPGAVVVDVAAEQGGNCELTRPGETVVHGHVTIVGPVNLPSS